MICGNVLDAFLLFCIVFSVPLELKGVSARTTLGLCVLLLVSSLKQALTMFVQLKSKNITLHDYGVAERNIRATDCRYSPLVNGKRLGRER